MVSCLPPKENKLDGNLPIRLIFFSWDEKRHAMVIGMPGISHLQDPLLSLAELLSESLADIVLQTQADLRGELLARLYQKIPLLFP